MNPFPDPKNYIVGKKTYTLNPLSAWDILDLPDLLAAIADKVPRDRKITPADMATAGKEEIRKFLAKSLNIPVDELKQIPADVAVTMLADWMEMNLTENFLQALPRLVQAGKQVLGPLMSSGSRQG